MRVAIVSDIHGNRQAFDAVLEDVRSVEHDAIWCLGDLVGYGADPDACVELARADTDLCLVGNHDLAVRGDLPLTEFSRGAALAAEWTRDHITEGNLSFLGELEPADVHQVVGLYHASPRDPVWEYVLSWEAARDAIHDSGTDVTIVGHSHVPLAIPQRDGPEGGHAPAGTEIELAGTRWLLNPGSVGQPRDGDPGAAWLLLDLDRGRASFRRTPYDVARVQEAIRAVGLPEALAERLAHGV
jgi:predicted phosphodiesterase